MREDLQKTGLGRRLVEAALERVAEFKPYQVIVLTFKTPVLLFFPYSREAAITVAHAARAFGKEDSLVYRKWI